jgi:hypothetical protein
MSHAARALLFTLFLCPAVLYAQSPDFYSRYCTGCHGADKPEAALDLSALPRDLGDPDHFRRWVKVHDRLASGEMPPAGAEQPPQAERTKIVEQLKSSLIAAERKREPAGAAAPLRRLTRGEYENTIRDLFDMPGIALAGKLPADGSAHGFDRNADALDISHVNVARYLEAADHILDYAIATRPRPPAVQKRRVSLVNRGGFVAHVVMNGDGVLLKNGRPDPEFPPAADQNHLDQGAHERFGSFDNGSSVGLFRHDDESFSPYFIEHVTVYPGRYRVRTSLWSFQWDKGQVLGGRGTEAARLSVVQLTGDGRGGQHPSYVLGYFDAPAAGPLEHQLNVWLNHNEIIGFNAASLAPVANYARKGRAMAFTGPGIVVDWLDIEGPLHDVWPPRSHRILFGNLPLAEFKAEEHPGMRPPARPKVRQLGAGMNRPDPEPGLWTIESRSPLEDADALFAAFLPKLFRRPVSPEIRRQYVDLVEQRLAAGDSFEAAMRAAFKTALCAPDFLYHVEPAGALDDYALACRLSYFLWNSLPDEQLVEHATARELRQPEILHAEIERLLQDARAQRFVDDFVGQWLKLREIAANDPDRKLYPEFSPYLQDSMVAETRAYFQQMLDRNLSATHVVQADFAMVNEKLATHYGIPGVEGVQVRNVCLPAGCARGGFLTQGSILKITANGTTTSPVPRGAFVMDRLLGEPPEPPPSNIAAIEPDVRGATTIREQLSRHREHAVCASCHAKIDPPGFALESFDVIGGFRNRYRSIGAGDSAERGAIDPFIPITFKLGPQVDSSGKLAGGQTFRDIRECQSLLAKDSERLLRNLARQLTVYATGRDLRFSDRAALNDIVRRAHHEGGGLRTLIHHVVGSPLFTGMEAAIERPASSAAEAAAAPSTLEETRRRMLMTADLPELGQVIIGPPTLPSTPQGRPPEISDAHTINLRVTGLFAAERADVFRSLMDKFVEVKLVTVDFDAAEATFAYDSECDLFKGAGADQIAERINNRVRQLSNHTLGLKPLGTLPREQWPRIEIPIVGLDCPACSLAAYEILMQAEGVEQAVASFHDRRAIAWIDPSRTNREKLVEALKQRQVVVGP